MGHGQIAGVHGERDVVFRLGEPLQKFNAGPDLGVGAFGHDHAGTLLGGDRAAARKGWAGQDGRFDGVALGVVGHHLGGEEGAAGRRADVGQQIAGLHVVAAEPAAGTEPALDVGHIEVIPQFADDVFVKMQGHDAVLGIKDGQAHLLSTAQQVVGQRITAEEGLAVVGGAGHGIRPVVVLAGHLHDAFHSGQVVVGHTGGRSKGGPVGGVQVEQLGGFCHREDLQFPIVHQVALGQKTVHIGGLLLCGQIGGQVYDLAHQVEVIGHVGIAGVEVGQGRSAHLALRSGQNVRFQVGHVALIEALDHDVLLFADGGVELVHQSVEAAQKIAAVIVPHRDGGGCLDTAAAAHTAQQQRSAQHQTDERTKTRSHDVSFPKTSRSEKWSPGSPRLHPELNRGR